MPWWNWNLSDWWRVKTASIRHRRRPRRGGVPLECLEARVVPSTNNALLSGIAFIDANGNTVNDANELVVRGIVVRLTGMSDANEAVNTQTTTDDEGEFTFIRVPVGTYTLTAEPGDRLRGASVTIAAVRIDSDSDSVTRNIAMGTIKPALISLRQFLTTTTLEDYPFATAGDGREPASNDTPIVANAPADITVAQNSSPTTIDLAGVFSDPNLDNSLIRLRTTGGDVNVELFDADAPQTVANFYNYITSGRYTDTIFHRLVNNFVLQGGGFKFDDATNTFPAVTTDPAIENEFSPTRSNIAGTLAMAKLGGDPDSATSQFFINLADNSSNLDNQNGGFTVFGRLVGATDTMVINNLIASPTTISNRSSTNSAFSELPLRNYTGTNFPTDASPSNFLRITGIDVVQRDEALTYSVVSNSNTDLVSATITNNRLRLTYTTGLFGTATIVVRATDQLGATVDATYNVRVDQLPTATVSLAPNEPVKTDTLTATATTADLDGDPVKLTYVWKVGTTTVQTTEKLADDPTRLTDTLDLTAVGTVNVGDTVTVIVTPNDGLLDGTAVSATKTIANRLPTATVSLSPDTPTTTDTLTATATAVDLDGDSVRLTYVWKVDGTIVRTQERTPNDSSYLTDSLDLNTLTGVTVSAGSEVTVEVTPNDGRADGTTQTASKTLA